MSGATGHFYPRSPCGERLPAFWSLDSNAGISIHALLAESDSKPNKLVKQKLVFLSTLSLRRATHQGRQNPKRAEFLSTLSLRRATRFRAIQHTQIDISIHALLAESDIISTVLLIPPIKFLSTLSLRRATVTVLGIQHRAGISIHALLAESDIKIRVSGSVK